MRLAIPRLWSKPPVESRAARRVRPAGPAPIEVQIMGRGSLDVLRVRDISVTGLGAYLPHRFEGCDVDAEVDLVLTLPGGRPFLTRGVIRHHTCSDEGDAHHFGIRFTGLSDSQRTLIERYIVRRVGE